MNSTNPRIGIILLFSLLAFNNFPNGVLGEAEKGQQKSSCGLVTDSIVDYALERFLGRDTLRPIPDVNTGTVRMSRGRLYGLSTIKRACPIVVTRPNPDENTSLSLSVCVKAARLRITAVLKVSTFFGFKIPEFLDVAIADVEMKAKLAANLRENGTIRLEDFDITQLGRISIDNAGMIGSFDRIISWLVNSKVKKVLIHFVESGVKSAVETELAKLKL